MARLEKESAAAKAAALALARDLRAGREKAARELAKAAVKRIAELGFREADFTVRLTTEPELGPTGDCACEFLFSPNVGEAPLPLHKIASSGELARVMLALKTILADLDNVPLLVFDEVDANVGGEIGRIVGERMAGIAKKHQVLCVTHLPQVAAQAANHFWSRRTRAASAPRLRFARSTRRRRNAYPSWLACSATARARRRSSTPRSCSKAERRSLLQHDPLGSVLASGWRMLSAGSP
jgi:DNA repair protein RecN (Recombination protein N)